MSAAAAAGAVEAWEVPDLLASLVNKSLAVFDPQAGRYRLLETVRQYAGDRLAERPAAEDAGARHLAFFGGVAEAAARGLQGPEQPRWLRRLEAEHDNLRAALTFALREAPDAALRLSGALWFFWFLHGHLTEGRDWLTRALDAASEAAPDAAPSLDRAKAKTGAASLAFFLGDPAAPSLLADSLAECRETGERTSEMWSLALIGRSRDQAGDYEQARVLCAECVDLARAAGSRWELALMLQNLGMLGRFNNDETTAEPLMAESVALFRELGDRWGLAWALVGLADVLRRLGRGEQARPLYLEAIASFRELGERRGVADCLGSLGELAKAEGDGETARRHFHECLAIFHEHGDRRLFAFWLEALAGLDAETGAAARAARLLGAADALREATHVPLPASERADHERSVASAREALGGDAFRNEWARGRGLSTDEVLALIRGGG
jgi:tetratricopeptide (TPR) repeat protein